MRGGHQLLRVDEERVSPLCPALEKKSIEMLSTALQGVDGVAISDYGKGFLTPRLLKECISLAKQAQIPVIIDPKGLDFTRYRGATLLKPNLSEAIKAAGLGIEASLEEVATELLRDAAVQNLIITRGEAGISVFRPGEERQDFPAQVHEVKDVTGAGDTVLATLTASLACGLKIAEACAFANLAAGLAIEQIGCARISIEQLHQKQSVYA